MGMIYKPKYKDKAGAVHESEEQKEANIIG